MCFFDLVYVYYPLVDEYVTAEFVAAVRNENRESTL